MKLKDRPRVKEIIVGAVALLTREGWCQGASQKTVRGKVKFCPWGALCEVLVADGMDWIGDPHRRWALDLLDMECRKLSEGRKKDVKKFSGLIAWNDEPGRTEAEVLALMNEVARSL